MPCLLVLVAFVSPRLALFFVLVFSDRLSHAFDNVFLPILGFFFLPWTTLIYTLAWTAGGVSGIGWFFVAFGFLIDVSSWGFGPRARRNRAAGSGY